MKLLAPIAAFIAAASAGQIYNTPSVENYANSAEIYQSALEHQQRGLYAGQSEALAGYEAANHRPAGEKTARILGYHAENDGHHYQYAYETENGIKAEEAGETLDKGTAAHGAFSYTGDDGHVYSVTYTADENGFRPSGEHLPTPPPVPEEILKSLEQNARDEAAGIFDDGKYHEHQELGHQGQSLEYHSSGQSGADLAYHAQAPQAGRILHHGPSHGSNLGSTLGSGLGSTGHGAITTHQVSSNHGSYFTPSSGANLGLKAGAHGANLGYQAQSASVLGHQSFGQQSTGHQSLGHQSLGHQSLGNQASFGHQSVNFQSGFQVSGHGGETGYSGPTGFSLPSNQGISGHGGMRYLPPSGQEAGLGYH